MSSRCPIYNSAWQNGRSIPDRRQDDRDALLSRRPIQVSIWKSFVTVSVGCTGNGGRSGTEAGLLEVPRAAWPDIYADDAKVFGMGKVTGNRYATAKVD
jgi:hypothetical protein